MSELAKEPKEKELGFKRIQMMNSKKVEFEVVEVTTDESGNLIVREIGKEVL